MNKTSFQKAILEWYSRHKRDLPWRKSTDPYIIWISEVILQQTRVSQGLPYFLKFQKNYPTVYHLAEAEEEKLLKDWEGLGYYSRARNLHSAARQIVDEYNGDFPDNHADIRKLKGVGDYTAAAVSSFAFNQPHAVVDGNVFRVLARVYGIDTPINTGGGKKEFGALAAKLIDRKDPATYNQAIMEFGAMQCVPKAPDCANCPLREHCVAYACDAVNEFPVKRKKNYDRARYLNYAIINSGGEVVVEQRTGKDIWHKLYQFPLVEHHNLLEIEQLMEELEGAGDWGESMVVKDVVDLKPHKLSHQTIHCRIFEIALRENGPMVTGEHQKWVAEDNLSELAFPRPLRMYLDRKQLTLPLDS